MTTLTYQLQTPLEKPINLSKNVRVSFKINSSRELKIERKHENSFLRLDLNDTQNNTGYHIQFNPEEKLDSIEYYDASYGHTVLSELMLHNKHQNYLFKIYLRDSSALQSHKPSVSFKEKDGKPVYPNGQDLNAYTPYYDPIDRSKLFEELRRDIEILQEKLQEETSTNKEAKQSLLKTVLSLLPA